MEKENLKPESRVKNKKSGNIGKVYGGAQYCSRRWYVRVRVEVKPGKFKYPIWSVKNLENNHG